MNSVRTTCYSVVRETPYEPIISSVWVSRGCEWIRSFSVWVCYSPTCGVAFLQEKAFCPSLVSWELSAGVSREESGVQAEMVTCESRWMKASLVLLFVTWSINCARYDTYTLISSQNSLWNNRFLTGLNYILSTLGHIVYQTYNLK